MAWFDADNGRPRKHHGVPGKRPARLHALEASAGTLGSLGRCLNRDDAVDSSAGAAAVPSADAQACTLLNDVSALIEHACTDAALELLIEGEAILVQAGRQFKQASKVIDALYWMQVCADDETGSRQALGILFRLAAVHGHALSQIEPHYWPVYFSALIASRTSPLPISRVLRQSMLNGYFRQTRDLPGGVVECGCARGNSFLQLCFEQATAHPGWRGEGFAVFDSFAGLSKPQTEDLDFSAADPAQTGRLQAMMTEGAMAFGYEEVSARILARFPAVSLHRGWLPQSLAAAPEADYRFVHIDVDLYDPTYGCLVYFYPRLVPGGIIVSDDFEWPGARKAFEQFCQQQQISMEVNGHGQACIRRPR